jgi:tetratricopeptide (TPR) repeat protein
MKTNKSSNLSNVGDSNLIPDISLSKRFFLILAVGILLMIFPLRVLAQSSVTLREVDEVIPTYGMEAPNPNPMFFFGQGSQGAEGRIYPYPFYDNLTNVKGDKTYHVIYLENEYIKISVLPEIGGRLFSGLDKTNNYDFVYHQHVIKPSLIGLLGAWISGGIEWNIPHHHRASTFIPVQWSKEEHPDGSKTIWVGELEVRQRMSWAVGYTLRPGSSVLECSVRIINRTPIVNNMLCFANVAVAPNDTYQVIFPPTTQWTTGHSKRAFNPYPIVDSVDISWYKNNKSSASWFCWNYQEDFVAGYDHGKNAGTMSVADHNIVPGKKFFTWGTNSMWDKILTDNDGPYLEIMVGAYSDNQPDYSWLQPYEERSFEMNWYPFRGIDGVKNANLDAAVNLDVKNNSATYGFYTTKAYTNATALLKAGNKVVAEEKISINPGKPYSKEISLPAGIDAHDVRASLTVDGKELIAYSPVRLQPEPKPVPVVNPLTPANIKNDEELFLAGQRIFQIQNPTLDADPYYEELLKRDPDNVSANTGMGILDLKDGKFSSAEKHFKKAIDRLTFQFTAPKNAEPLYYYGVALKAQGKMDEAFTAFFKATWSQEWKSPAYFSLAEIASLRGDFTAALNYVSSSLDANALNVRAYGLKAAILRHLNRTQEAIDLLSFATEKTDPLDVRLMAEKCLAIKDAKTTQTLVTTMVAHPATAQEMGAEYANAGLWQDGIDVLLKVIEGTSNKESISPLVYYYLGDFAEKTGNTKSAGEYRHQAALQPTEYVFPFQYELVNVLRRAMEINPQDARAPYYLGNLLFDGQPAEATALWEKSAALDPKVPMVWRNLSVAYSHEPGENSVNKAISALEKAVALNDIYPTHFYELDKFYQSAGTPVEKRLAILEQNQKVVVKKDESLGALINLKTMVGKPEEAIALLKSRIFIISEGGSAFSSGQAWVDAYLVLGMKHYSKKQYKEALADFVTAVNLPENLRSEQRGFRQTEINYWTGCAQAALGEKDKARQSWEKVASSGNNRTRASGGGGQPLVLIRASQGEQRYYQALAKQKLGNKEGNEAVFHELVDSGTAALKQREDPSPADMPSFRSGRQSVRSNTAMAHYNMGLGYMGLSDKTKAREEFTAALKILPDYLSARIALDQI